MLHARDGRQATLLWLTYGLPYPPVGGAQQRDYHLLTRVARRVRVSLVSLLDAPAEAAHADHLRAHCAAVAPIAPPPRGPWGDARALAAALRAGQPAATVPFVRAAAAARLRAAALADPPDLVQIEHSFLAPYRAALPAGNSTRPMQTILSLHNVGASQYGSMWRLRGTPRERLLFAAKGLLLRGWEASEAARFDRTLVVSEADGARLAAGRHRPCLRLVENGVACDRLRPLPEAAGGDGLLFVGTLGYRPNVDAVLHFCERVLPLVRRARPAAHLTVVGRAPDPALRRLAGRADVTVVGDVADVTPFYAAARAVVVPLRAGGGTRLKILEAMALGRPVVSTTLGCEGLAVRDDVHLTVADAPAAFANAVVRLLADAPVRAGLTAAARALVETRYDWDAIAGRLLLVYDELLCQGSPAARRPQEVAR